MARLKKIKNAPTTEPSHTLPEHTRVLEWNGFKRGDLCRVRYGRKGSTFLFMAHVTSPEGNVSIEVLEQQSAGRSSRGPRLWRNVNPDNIMPMPYQVRKRLEAKENM